MVKKLFATLSNVIPYIQPLLLIKKYLVQITAISRAYRHKMGYLVLFSFIFEHLNFMNVTVFVKFVI